MIPAREFWAFAPFFLIFVVFFFDMRMMSIATAGVALSIAVSWAVRGEALFAAPGEFFWPDAMLRVVCLALTAIRTKDLREPAGRDTLICGYAPRPNTRGTEERDAGRRRAKQLWDTFILYGTGRPCGTWKTRFAARRTSR